MTSITRRLENVTSSPFSSMPYSPTEINRPSDSSERVLIEESAAIWASVFHCVGGGVNGERRITISPYRFDARPERHASIDQRRKHLRLVLSEGRRSEAKQETEV